MAPSSTSSSARSPELQKHINEVQSRLADFIESTRPAHEANLRGDAQSTLRTPAEPQGKIDRPKNLRSRRSTALADAKNVLRAASAVTSKSLNGPSPRRSPSERGPMPRRSFSEGGAQFIHHSPDIARHRRKCAVCHHPEREAIEDLFIHWHSPEAIASHYDDDEQENESITWLSIYRHAYAFGLDESRRRNLRFVFEHILDQAGTIAATPTSIIFAARALGSCVNANGEWNEPPKRVIVTNIVRNEPPQKDFAGGSSPSVPDQTEDFSGPPSSSDNQPSNNSSSFRACPEPAPRGGQSRTASFPRDVVAGPPSSSATAPASPEPNVNPSSDAETTDGPQAASETGRESAPCVPRAFVGADVFRRLAPPEGNDNRPFGLETGESATASPTLGGRSLPACPDEGRAQAGFSSDNKNEGELSSFRASYPRDVFPPAGKSDVPVSARPAFIEADRSQRPASPEIRNSPNSINFKEPPISNR